MLPRVKNVLNIRAEEKFCDIWDEIVTQIDAYSRRTRCNNALMQNYVVEETTGSNEMNKDEMRKLFHSTLHQIINQISLRFSHQNTKPYAAVSALQLENNYFLDVKMVQPVLDLVDRPSVETEFVVAKTYIAKLIGDEKTKPTTIKLFSEHCEALKTVHTVILH